jgi:PEP-CTERM motif
MSFININLKETIMKNLLKFPFRLTLAFAAGLAVSTLSANAQSATATISGVQDGANFDYTILLHNTGSTSLNSFWYGWIQFENDLPTDPSSANNSLGWANNLDGNSIQWENSTGTALAAGQTATFTFVDSSTPAQITAGISGESVAYVGSIDFSQSAAGDSTGIFTPTLVAAPEPSTFALLGAGLVLTAVKIRYSRASRR